MIYLHCISGLGQEEDKGGFGDNESGAAECAIVQLCIYCPQSRLIPSPSERQ
jgi:hypothetical protein